MSGMRGSIQRQVAGRRPSGTPMHTGGSWWVARPVPATQGQLPEPDQYSDAFTKRFYAEVAARNPELQSSRFGKVPGSLIHGPSEHLASFKPSKKWEAL